jgi:hypothetical protein
VLRASINPILVSFSHAWSRGRACPVNCLLRPNIPQQSAIPFALMSHSHPAAVPSSNFQLIINNALKAYKKRTREDLLFHPLASQLESCDSPAAILAILQQQAQGLEQSQNVDERWTKWLEPTVNVLFAFSATLGSGVGLVCPTICASPGSARSYLSGRYSHLRAWFLLESVFSFQCVSSMTWHGLF